MGGEPMPTFSADGKSILACGEGQEPCVYEWDVVTGRLRHEVKLGEDFTPLGLALHPDGKTMAVSDYGNRNNRNFSGRVLLLERGTGKVVRELPTPGAPASRVTFSPDGRWLAVAAGSESTSGTCKPARRWRRARRVIRVRSCRSRRPPEA